jgi:conjugal transfer pilus assembly protein TraV
MENTMNPYNTIASCILILSLFTACSPLKTAINPYEENFKCRAKDNEGKCVDTPTAYKDARYPDIDEGADPAVNDAKQEVQGNRYRILAELLQEPKKPLLQPPKVLRVLLLPYKGEDDELFMTRYVYLKIEDAKWILTDLDEK